MTLVYATGGMELAHGEADGMKRFGDMFGFGMSVLGRLCSRAAKCLGGKVEKAGGSQVLEKGPCWR